MYVLIHNNNVLTGPMNWDYGMFLHATAKENIAANIPAGIPDTMPYVIDQNTMICEYDEIYPTEINTKIEMTYGPFWDLSSIKAIATYRKKDKDIDSVKGNLKDIAAAKRYAKEILGTQALIQNTEVTVDTNRGSRDMFIQKYSLMGEADIVKWKFPEGWLVLTKADLGNAVNAGVSYVQQCFDWESDISDEIDAATTLHELDAIVIE